MIVNNYKNQATSIVIGFMSDSLGNDIWGDFNRLWAESKTEIFRVQFLNTYRVSGEEEQFNAYMEGKTMNLDNDLGTKAWMNNIRKKRVEGVRNINLIVVDLPLSDYMKFAIDVHYNKQVQAGREILFLDRKAVSNIVPGFKDYWEFDSKTVIPMKYDSEGHFLGGGRIIINSEIVSKYTHIKNTLLKHAISMEYFLRVNNIIINQPKPKKVKI